MSRIPLLDDDRLTRDEAATRAALIDIDRYEIELDISGAKNLQESTYGVRTTLHFRASTPGETTFLNYLGDSVQQVMLNDVALDVAQVVGSARILLPELAEHNYVTVVSRSRYSYSGEGLHRFVDPADGQTYLYSQFEPADARRVYPTMEQPDLKAAFHVSMIGPEDWVLASNGEERDREKLGGGLVRVRFVPTHPVSTYLTTFLAGPYAQFTDQWQGHAHTAATPIELRLFARQSLREHVDAAELFKLTKQGLTWFHDQFDYAYPWGKYDQAFVPEYNLGAMENPGLVTFNEAYIFTSYATVAQHMARATTLMHEMSHMWFGDLVTMQWWDDLWLKESFADFYGTKAVAEATDLPGAWESFAHQRKAWAYVQDSYPTTHPIVADIVDLEAARQNFDGITYAKGAAVIKQLFHWVGQDAFLAACRSYFQRFAFGTAQLADFLQILEDSSGRDMTSWAVAWLQTSGPATLRAVVDRQGMVTAQQHAIEPHTGAVLNRPHALHIAVFTLNEQDQLTCSTAQAVTIPEGQSSVTVPNLVVPDSEPRVVLVNYHDLTYAQVTLDEQSVEAITSYPLYDEGSTAAATVWSSLWTMVRRAELSAIKFVTTVAQFHEHLHDVSMHARVLDQAVVALHEFAPIRVRAELHEILANALLAALQDLEHGSDRQRSAARALTKLGYGHPALASVLKAILTEEPGHSPGLVLDDEMRWAILIALASVGSVTRQELTDHLAQAHTASNELAFRTAEAALPERQVQESLWQQVLDGHDATREPLSNATLTAITEGLAISGVDLLVECLPRLLDALTDLWSSRSNNLASRTINGLIPTQLEPVDGGPEAQNQHPVIGRLTSWLETHTAAPAALRRIIIERRADLLLRVTAQAQG